MKCAYCGKETKGTKEHIISSAILDLFPECYLTYDGLRKKVYKSDPMIKDVCAKCNNERISYIDSYAKKIISQYFTQKYTDQDTVEIEYNYTMIQKMLLKYAFNDMRSHKDDYSYFDEEILHFLMDEKDNVPKKYITVLCGLAVNVSPVPDALLGNLKLQWCKDPIIYSNSVIRNIDYETGEIFLNDDVKKLCFDDLKLSYLFRFNSAQFLLMCWDKCSTKIRKNNIILSFQYPYYLMKLEDKKAKLPVCTNGFNYHSFGFINAKLDLLFEVDLMRLAAYGGEYKLKEIYEKEWEKEEEKIKKKYSR